MTQEPTGMTVEQRFELLRELDARDERRSRNAALGAWISVAIAAIVLAALVYGASIYVARAFERASAAEQRVKDAQKELAEINATLEQQHERLMATTSELATKEEQLAAVTQTLGNVPERARRAAIEVQFKEDPKAAQLLPRAYVQIVEEADRAWAAEVKRWLEASGVIVPGIENVPKAVNLARTEVRYYKKAEEPGAKSIADFLGSIGIAATTVHLQKEENNPNVRPKHYEIWFVRGSRETHLQGAASPAR